MSSKRIPSYVHNQDSLRCLGEGSYGPVYELSDRRVLKLTSDRWEAETARWQQEHKHPLLVKVHAIYELDGQGTDSGDYLVAIVRERADNFELHEDRRAISDSLEDIFSKENMNPWDVRPANIGRVVRKDGPVSVVRDLGAVSPPGGRMRG